MPNTKRAAQKKNDIKNFIGRVKKQKACGIIYNYPKDDSAMLVHNLLDNKNIALDGINAYSSDMLKNRLGSWLKIKGLKYNMLPSLIEDKLIVIYRADIIKGSYSKVLDDFHKYKIPLLLIMHNETAMKDFRKLAAYNRVLTIEADYNIFN